MLKITPDKTTSLFVKDILVFKSLDKNITTHLPFFADGYPGFLFYESDGGLKVNPHNKAMPNIFLYGQTIHPVELEIVGAYQVIVFQLYPFVLRTFFDVIPESINDNCYYLENIEGNDISEFTNQLLASKTVENRIDLISNLLLFYFEKKKENLDFKIRQAIQQIMKCKGQENINTIAENIELNIRTFERRFLKETGLSPKQFSKIIQFQASLKQLTVKDFSKLTDVVYENGYSDQSHFIRVFKAFTGKTPKKFKP
ncbi:helix-turn-helix domain-containing protein [Tenacibaculum sp. SDUM215027]|uniref:helix-turn-helix domain-containing protein n=1 Tax=Tenacibaculum sp. SDUM215027 TaxID=3422596 RepID=UPI003D31C070